MNRQRKKRDSSYKAAHMCSYSYFPRVEGMLDDGINAFSMEFQQNVVFQKSACGYSGMF